MNTAVALPARHPALAVALVVNLLILGAAEMRPPAADATADGPATRPAGPNPDRLRMALVNPKCLTSDGPDATANRANIAANLERHTYFVERAVAAGAEFVGFPELSVNGYHFSPHTTWLSLDGPEVKTLAGLAAKRGVYIAAGIAEQDAAGKRWNTHFILGPTGEVVGRHHKIWLTQEKGYTAAGTDHNVFDVKGVKVGIATCADGTDRKNLQALADRGARIIYGPHANTTGGTTAGWYKFRAAWGGPDGWVAQLKVYAALHNHAAVYDSEFDPPPADPKGRGGAAWASGAWFIGPDGRTLAQMPSSTRRDDSREFLLVYDIPLADLAPPAAPATRPAE